MSQDEASRAGRPALRPFEKVILRSADQPFPKHCERASSTLSAPSPSVLRTGGVQQNADVGGTRQLRENPPSRGSGSIDSGQRLSPKHQVLPELLDSLPQLWNYSTKPCRAKAWMSAGGFAVSVVLDPTASW